MQTSGGARLPHHRPHQGSAERPAAQPLRDHARAMADGPQAMALIEAAPVLRAHTAARVAADVWSTVGATLLFVLLVLGVFEASLARADPVLAIALVGVYGLYAQRQDLMGWLRLMLWISFGTDLVWLCMWGPLHLTRAQLGAMFGGTCHPDGLRACLGRHASLDTPDGLAALALLLLMATAKTALLLLLPRIRAAYEARHGKTLGHQLAPFTSARAVSIGRTSSRLGELLLLLGSLLCAIRDDYAASLMLATIVIPAALARRATAVRPRTVHVARVRARRRRDAARRRVRRI